MESGSCCSRSASEASHPRVQQAAAVTYDQLDRDYITASRQEAAHRRCQQARSTSVLPKIATGRSVRSARKLWEDFESIEVRSKQQRDSERQPEVPPLRVPKNPHSLYRHAAQPVKPFRILHGRSGSRRSDQQLRQLYAEVSYLSNAVRDCDGSASYRGMCKRQRGYRGDNTPLHLHWPSSDESLPTPRLLLPLLPGTDTKWYSWKVDTPRGKPRTRGGDKRNAASAPVSRSLDFLERYSKSKDRLSYSADCGEASSHCQETDAKSHLSVRTADGTTVTESLASSSLSSIVKYDPARFRLREDESIEGRAVFLTQSPPARLSHVEEAPGEAAGSGEPGNNRSSAGSREPGNQSSAGGREPGNQSSAGGREPGNQSSAGGREPGNQSSAGGREPGNQSSAGSREPGNQSSAGGREPGNQSSAGGREQGNQASAGGREPGNQSSAGGREPGNQSSAGSREPGNQLSVDNGSGSASGSGSDTLRQEGGASGEYPEDEMDAVARANALAAHAQAAGQTTEQETARDDDRNQRPDEERPAIAATPDVSKEPDDPGTGQAATEADVVPTDGAPVGSEAAPTTEQETARADDHYQQPDEAAAVAATPDDSQEPDDPGTGQAAPEADDVRTEGPPASEVREEEDPRAAPASQSPSPSPSEGESESASGERKTAASPTDEAATKPGESAPEGPVIDSTLGNDIVEVEALENTDL